MKIEAHPQLKLNQLSDAEQEAIETDCVRFLVELCCQINLQEVKILFVVGPVLAANLQQNHLSILPLVQGWPTRGSRAACSSLPGFTQLFFTSLVSSISSLVLVKIYQ